MLKRMDEKRMNDLLHRLGLAVVSMESKAGGWPWLSHGTEVVCALLEEAAAEIRRLERLTKVEQAKAAKRGQLTGIAG
jgi:hypothetical protein